MDGLRLIKQAYPQAPWRSQLQMLVFFLVIVVLVALVAGFYLSVSARAAAVGRDIQGMQNQLELLEQENEDLKARLANITSSGALDDRANEMEFKPLDLEEALYVKVPGYSGREPITLASTEEKPVISAEVLPDEYTESIFTWLLRYIRPYINQIFED
jgi:cell division protein FtsL